jgi:hypothetical protein
MTEYIVFMQGLIISKNSYVYIGDIIGNLQNGNGKIIYKNGDTYEGNFLYGKFDGFGKYTYANGSYYMGYFSYDMYNGIGTYEDENIILQGEWRNDIRHGSFIITNKKTFNSMRQIWVNNKCTISSICQYVPPLYLQTKFIDIINLNNQHIHEKKCITCLDNIADSTNNLCGHICMCYECLTKVAECPICRCPIGFVLKLFVC